LRRRGACGRAPQGARTKPRPDCHAPARLTDALIDGLIDRELFEERQAALLAEKRTLEERLANLKDSGMTGAERLSNFLERLDSTYTLYETGTVEEERELLAEFRGSSTHLLGCLP
jgi:hypothetical protein